MAVYTIIRVYEVAAENRIEATERMLEALDLETERDFHVRDYIREPGEKAGKGRQVDLRPSFPALRSSLSWWTAAGALP